MWPLEYFSKKERTKRRIKELLLPADQEEFFHIATFGNINDTAQRIAALQHRMSGSIRCVFLIFEDGVLSHFVEGPRLFEREYKTLLSDLEHNYNKPSIIDWTRVDQALIDT